MNYEKLHAKIRQLKEKINFLTKQHEADIQQHELDKQRIDYLEELLALRNRALFAKKLEKVIIDEQVTLFDVIELEECISETEKKLEETEEKIAKLENTTPRKKKRNLINICNFPFITKTIEGTMFQIILSLQAIKLKSRFVTNLLNTIEKKLNMRLEKQNTKMEKLNSSTLLKKLMVIQHF